MNILISVIQRAFFGRRNRQPNSRWVERVKTLGKYCEFSVQRRGKNLSCYLVHPEAFSDESGDEVVSKKNFDLVIFSHPISRKGKFFFGDGGRAQAYLKRGYSVMAFDYNGFGESDTIDLFYWRDVLAVINHAQQQFPGCKMVLHGTSFGAFHIIRALEYMPQGAEVVLENVNKSLLSYWCKWPITGLLVRFLEFLRVKAVREMDVQKVVREFRRQDLHIQFIACEDDHLTTPAEMRELFEQLATENKSFTFFKGAGHLSAPNKDPVLYQSVLFNRGCRPC